MHIHAGTARIEKQIIKKVQKKQKNKKYINNHTSKQMKKKRKENEMKLQCTYTQAQSPRQDRWCPEPHKSGC